MAYIVRIKISHSIVLQARNKEMLPVPAVSDMLEECYKEKVSISDKTPVALTVTVQGSSDLVETLKNRVLRFLASQFGAEEKDISFSIEEKPDNEEKKEASGISAMDMIQEVLDELDRELEEMDSSETNEEKNPDEISEALPFQEEKTPRVVLSDTVWEVKKKIDALVGAESFKALADELIALAPQIIANNTADIFTGQSYIFSINDGYGLTTCLSLFRELIDALGMKKVDLRRPIYEKKLHAKSNTNLDPFSEVNQVLSSGSKGVLQFLSVDISEWMNKTDTAEFKEFLHNLVNHTNETLVIFRIPFVEKDVLASIYHSLNDMVFVKTVTFPPLTNEEIRSCAEARLLQYGFQISDTAWEFFDLRITEEKSDGRFYGLNTIHKVVKELLYKKQLDNGRKGEDDHLIGKSDAQSLCSASEGDDRSAWEMLTGLVGADAIRTRVEEIISQILLAKNNASVKSPCIHMRFVGNPGTGKTTVARIVGKILKEKGVLRIGNFYEYAGRDLVGRYIGETAPKTASICRDAYGSVLFIDEAYSLYRGPDNDKDFGKEALDTLIAEMENHRSDLVIIMAGYTDDMEKLMQGNAGLASRMPYIVEFPNFSREELYRIFVSMAKKDFLCDEELFVTAKEYFLSLPDEFINSKEFSNARFVRNLYERVWAKAAMRTQLDKGSTVVLTKGDFERSAADKEFRINSNVKKKNRIGFVE